MNHNNHRVESCIIERNREMVGGIQTLYHQDYNWDILGYWMTEYPFRKKASNQDLLRSWSPSPGTKTRAANTKKDATNNSYTFRNNLSTYHMSWCCNHTNKETVYKQYDIINKQ